MNFNQNNKNHYLHNVHKIKSEEIRTVINQSNLSGISNIPQLIQVNDSDELSASNNEKQRQSHSVLTNNRYDVSSSDSKIDTEIEKKGIQDQKILIQNPYLLQQQVSTKNKSTKIKQDSYNDQNKFAQKNQMLQKDDLIFGKKRSHSSSEFIKTTKTAEKISNKKRDQMVIMSTYQQQQNLTTSSNNYKIQQESSENISHRVVEAQNKNQSNSNIDSLPLIGKVRQQQSESFQNQSDNVKSKSEQAMLIEYNQHHKLIQKTQNINSSPLSQNIDHHKALKDENNDNTSKYEQAATDDKIMYYSSKIQTENENYPVEDAIKSKAKKEKVLLNYNCIVRERDLLREFLKRTTLNQETNYITAFQAYNNQKKMPDFSSPNRENLKNRSSIKEALMASTDQDGEQINDKIVFQSNGRDTYFKRAALRKKHQEGIWIENPTMSSYFFTVKWDYGDSNFHHDKVKPHQYFNHYPDTRELTTKQGLNKNLNQITAPGVDVYSFYPRCFDLSIPRELDLFIADFNQTSILNCIQKHATFFEQIIKEQHQSIDQIIQQSFKIESTFQICQNQKFEKQKAIKKQLESMEFSSGKYDLGHVNTSLISQALYYCQNLLNDTIGIDQDPYFVDELFKKNCYLPSYNVSLQNQEIIQNYSTFDFPLKLETVEESKFQKLRRQRGWVSVCRNLNLYIVYLVIKMSKNLHKYWPQYGEVNGCQNVWICKPCYNARGFGIFCFNQKSEIINTFSKKAPAPKIVQKYIERPLLLKNLNPKTASDLRKFDIRQWVLVTSIEPLQVYIYQSAYLRICGSNYSIQDYDDPLRHLSNYTIQKHQQDHEDECNQNEYVMSTSDFIQKLNSEYPELEGKGHFSWQTHFHNQIKDITMKVFEQMSEVMENKSSSFELYGLDFVIDEKLKCWLIEANMSPACAIRKGQEWLSHMTDDMADGMINIIEGKILKNMATSKVPFNGPLQDKINDLESGSYKPDIKNWEQIEFYNKTQTKVKSNQTKSIKQNGQQTFQRSTIGKGGFQVKNANQNENIDIIGKSLNMKFERNLDRKYRKWQSAIQIQRIWRGFRVRNQVDNKKIKEMQRRSSINNFIQVLQLNVLNSIKRKTKLDPAQSAFNQLQKHYWTQRIDENKLRKVISLQQQIRKFLNIIPDFKIKMDSEEEESDVELAPMINVKKLNFEETPVNDQQQNLMDRMNEKIENSLIESEDYEREFDQIMNYNTLHNGFNKKSQGKSQRKFKKINKMSKTQYSVGFKIKKTSQKPSRHNKMRDSNVSWKSASQKMRDKHDPDLLLNYQQLGVEMIIPTNGKHFQMQGGMIIRRKNSENPIHQIDKQLQIQYQQMMPEKTPEQVYGINTTVKSIQSIYCKQTPIKQPLKNSKRSVYENFDKDKVTLQVKNKNIPVSNSTQSAGFYNSSFKKHENSYMDLQKSQPRSFSNNAIMQRINECYQIVATPPPQSFIVKDSPHRINNENQKMTPGRQTYNSKTNPGVWRQLQQPPSQSGDRQIKRKGLSPYMFNTAYGDQQHHTTFPKTTTTSGQNSNMQINSPIIDTSLKPRNLFSNNFRENEIIAQDNQNQDSKSFSQRLQREQEAQNNFFKKRSIIQSHQNNYNKRFGMILNKHNNKVGTSSSVTSQFQSNGVVIGLKPKDSKKLFQSVLNHKSIQPQQKNKLFNQKVTKQKRQQQHQDSAMPQIQNVMNWC